LRFGFAQVFPAHFSGLLAEAEFTPEIRARDIDA
jgi:hypothetical protein